MQPSTQQIGRPNMTSTPQTAILTQHLAVVRPAGPGPFPVVVQMHGCGGIQPLHALYAEAARAAGVAVVTIDSLGPRGITKRQAQLTVCSGMRLRGAERAGDLIAALRWLEGRSWADTRRVAAAGWSHGGWAIMEAMVAATSDPSAAAVIANLKLAVLIYPYAGPLARTAAHGWGQHRPKVLACLGGKDGVVGRAAPRRALARLEADGLDVTVLNFADATHAFDDAHADDPRTRYRPDLFEELRSAYAQALVSALGGE